MQDILQVFLELFQNGDPLRRGLHHFLLVDKDLPAIPLHQRPQALAHAPAYISQYLKTLRPRHQKSDAVVPQCGDGFGKALEGLQVESRKVELLKLFRGIHDQTLPRMNTDTTDLNFDKPIKSIQEISVNQW